jgi:membrane protein implicated in regulation of membrane protease activity
VILLLALVLALVLMPWPWSLVVIAAAACCEIAIAVFGIRYTRRRRSTVGVERLIGASAEVVAALTPTGQVRLDGEIWRAHAETGLRVGDTVRIKSVEGLTLEVEPAPGGSSAST